MNGHPIAGRLAVTAADNRADRLTALFDSHYDRLYRLARRLVPSADEALDLVQETFLKTANSLKSVPSAGASQEEAWLVRVLINIQRDLWRKAGVRNRYIANTDRNGQSRKDPETALIAKTTIWRALDLLHARRRAVVVDDEVIVAPVVRSAIGPSAVISGNYSKDQAERIVNGIRAN